MANNDIIISRIFESIVDEELLDDRREYGVEDLEKAYALTTEEAERLQLLIKAATDVDYDICKADPKKVHEAIIGSFDTGFEGYTEAEKVLIQAFLADLALATQHME